MFPSLTPVNILLPGLALSVVVIEGVANFFRRFRALNNRILGSVRDPGATGSGGRLRWYSRHRSLGICKGGSRAGAAAKRATALAVGTEKAGNDSGDQEKNHADDTASYNHTGK
jgi:hypothetical protein